LGCDTKIVTGNQDRFFDDLLELAKIRAADERERRLRALMERGGRSRKPGDIKDGHTYCLLAVDGEHYAKLHVIKFDKAQGTLEFTWQYQPKATNKFE